MLFSLSMQRFSVLMLSVLAAGIGTGCGGGDSSSGAVSLASPASTTLSGTAAVGSPIVGGGLNVVCSAGAPLMTSTSANGSWTVDTTSQTFPCAVQVKGGTVAGATNLITYHSIALNPGIANVTPLTDLLLANLAGTATPSAWYASVGHAFGFHTDQGGRLANQLARSLRGDLSQRTPPDHRRLHRSAR